MAMAFKPEPRLVPPLGRTFDIRFLSAEKSFLGSRFIFRAGMSKRNHFNLMCGKMIWKMVYGQKRGEVKNEGETRNKRLARKCCW